MASSVPPVVYVTRAVFGVLGVLMLATLTYTLLTDGSPFRRELLTPWMIATLVDFYINVIAISVWVFYKESSAFHALIWIVFLVCFGSITTCTYVVLQLSRISYQDPEQDPAYQTLQHRNGRQTRSGKEVHSSVLLWRIVFSVLGCIMLVTLIYTLFTDGSPFRRELLTPWMTATLIDFYINVAAIALWVTHKEQNWISTLFWTALLICFGSITTCVYIVKQLFQVSTADPVQLILFEPRNKQVRSAFSG